MGPRIITAGLAAPTVVACAVAGGLWFIGLVHLVAALAAWELCVLQRQSAYPGVPALALLGAWAFPVAAATHPAVAWALLGVGLIGALVMLGLVAPSRDLLLGGAISLAGGLYVGTLLAPSIPLRQGAEGLIWVLVVIIGTWGCDTAAFVVGRQWGRRKLVPGLSPQKSLEGATAGLVAAWAVSAAAAGVASQSLPRLIGLGTVVGVGAILGDLAESAIKRCLGVKDSGWIMPGHGGILDRIDGLLFASFLAYWYRVASEAVMSP